MCRLRYKGVVNVLVSPKLSVALACAHGGKIDQFAVLIFAVLLLKLFNFRATFGPGGGRTASSCFALCLLAVFLFTFWLNAQRSDKF